MNAPYAEHKNKPKKEVTVKMVITDRFKRAWNAIRNKDPTINYMGIGPSYSYRPDRARYSRGNERSIITAIFNRIAMDVASIDVMHVQLDEDNRFVDSIDSGLNNCLTVEANMDQTHRAFMQDVVQSMLDEGVVAIVPTDIDDQLDSVTDIEDFDGFDVLTLRTGKIVEWMPKHVRVRLYNDENGSQEEVVLPKSMVCIIENPFYAVVNESNSTFQRLIRKMSLLDAVDEQTSSGKLDLIIQLPYQIRSEARRAQAEDRRQDIEKQLTGSKYGIAYADSTEKITQLNRPVENNLIKTIEYLTSLAHSQLGITQEIMNGTADAKTMLNYFNRTIEPILSAIVDEMKRKFLTRKAREKKESIAFFRDSFSLVPVDDIAEIADKFTRNEIMTSNEIRQKIGMKPSKDPNADVLRNKNLSASTETIRKENEQISDKPAKKETSQNG